MIKNYKAKLIAEPGKQDFILTRVFDASRDRVFKAFIDPRLYIQWIGPSKYTTILEKFEPRNGCSWRYTQKDKDGNQFAFHGVYHEVLAPSRLIDTFEFEGLPETGHVSLETATFEELPGVKTLLKVHSVFQSVGDRDGMIQSGMEEGVNESFDRLEALLKRPQK
jgi:uncharacterized protein YndB with AHSA1/START domain